MIRTADVARELKGAVLEAQPDIEHAWYFFATVASGSGFTITVIPNGSSVEVGPIRLVGVVETPAVDVTVLCLQVGPVTVCLGEVFGG